MDPNGPAGGVHVPFSYWLGFFALVTFLLSFDLFFHRHARRIGNREAVGWVSFWFGLAMAFNVWVYFRFGKLKALEFLTGYLVEEALSIDNIFVFVVIFRYFQVKPQYQHRILFWGILGAILMRLLFILAGVELIERVHFTIYVLGALLVFTGLKLLLHEEGTVDPGRNWALRIFKRCLPTTQDFEGPRFLVKREGRWFATPLLLVLVVVETTDVVFAVDSVPAIIAITRDRFIVFTSNIFAILGLRSFYFLLAGMVEAFRFLKVGLSLVLVFIGAIMVIPEVILTVPITIKLAVIAGLLATSVVASLVLPRPSSHRAPPK